MTTTAYPAHLETDVVLRTGRTLRVRPVRPDDREELMAFYRKLSPESVHRRFFGSVSMDSEMRGSPVDVDYGRQFGMVAVSGEEIVGVAHYFASGASPGVAEVAFAIADQMQGCGIATRLLEMLAAIAREHGFKRFEAEVLAENRSMLNVFRTCGFEVESGFDSGTVHVSFSIAQTSLSVESAAKRSQKAAAASMRAIFAPRSVAVVGASRQNDKMGAQILRNLRASEFKGALHAVNPKYVEVERVLCYPTLTSIAESVDLAIVAVPADRVEAVVDDAIAKGVKALIVITAGFGETGESGLTQESRLLEKVRMAGIRLVGPNCMGVINTDPDVKLHATFSSTFPPPGNVAMSSQSGALGLAALDYATSLNIGFSTFISVGNKVDVSGNDLIQYWCEDTRTDVILLYLESFGNPKKFSEIARRVSRQKPIVAVKAGRSSAGAKAALSHTGALTSSDAVVDALFRRTGVIRVDTLEEMFDVATLLSQQPLPRGRRVAIMTNAGGPGILAADACASRGLKLADLNVGTTAQLRALLPVAASVGNPIDMIASATADHYRQTLRLLIADPNVDAINIIYIPVTPDDATAVATAIRQTAAESGEKTIVATFMSAHGLPEHLAPVPSFSFPERAVVALARAADYAEWRSRPEEAIPTFTDIDVGEARAIVDGAAIAGGWLDPLDSERLCRAARIHVAPSEHVATATEAMEAAMRLGFPVVLKAKGPTLLHKTEARALRLGIGNEPAVYEAFFDLQQRLGDTMTGVIVQKMVSDGAEVMVGVTEDPAFGHVIAYGAGGTLVELMADVALRLHPLTEADADEMIRETRYSKVLSGFRGSVPLDVAALKEVLLRLDALVTLCPEIREVDINPLKVLPHGAAALDTRIRVEKVVPGPPVRRVTY